MSSESPSQTPAATHPDDVPSIAILGLGEAGRIYATALAAAGYRVTGYDPYNTQPTPGVEIHRSLQDAVRDADLAFTLTPAGASHAVAREAVGALRSKAVYADFTSSAPEAKRALQNLFTDRDDVRLVDVAILGPVIQLGTSTPLLAAGPAADEIAQIMRHLGTDVEVVDGTLGDAMGHKLLRSVFMKSLAATVTEAVNAGRAAHHEEWIRDQIARELSGDGHQTINRFLRGTAIHAARRSEEMEAAAEYLDHLGVAPTMSQAAATLHRELAGPTAPDAAATT